MQGARRQTAELRKRSNAVMGSQAVVRGPGDLCMQLPLRGRPLRRRPRRKRVSHRQGDLVDYEAGHAWPAVNRGVQGVTGIFLGWGRAA